MEATQFVVLVLKDVCIEVGLEDALFIGLVHALYQGGIVFVELLYPLLVLVLFLGDEGDVLHLLLLLGGQLGNLVLQMLDFLRLHVDEVLTGGSFRLHPVHFFSVLLES